MALEKRGKYFRYEFVWQGKRIRKPTKLTNREAAKRAEARHRERLAMIDAGLPVPPDLQDRDVRPPTLRDYIPTFLEWSKALHRRATYNLHRSNCSALERHLGDVRLDEIKRPHVELFMRKRAEEQPVNVVTVGERKGEAQQLDGTVSPCTVNRAVTTLRLLFHQAEGEWEYLKNPTRGVELLEEPEPQYILTQEEFDRYLKVTPEDLKHVAMLMRERGLRPQDCVSITEKQCDFETGVLELWPKPELAGRSRNRNRAIGGKVKGSSRPIVMTPTMRAVLKERLEKAKQEGTRYLFPMRDWHGRLTADRHRTVNSLGKPHRAAIKKAKLPKFRLYDLRHTFATCAARDKVNLRAIQGVLGHSSLDMTKRYTRFDVELQRSAFADLEKVS